ncbi:MAG: nif-specific transcriptional activator NifA [Rhizomicrobium sp.]
MALSGVYEISKLLASPNRLEPTLSGVLALLSSFLDMRHGLIALLGPSGEAEIVVGSGWSETNAKRFFELLPERAIGQIVVTKMPLVISDISRDPLFARVDLNDFADKKKAPISFIGVPIKEGDQVLGTLTIDRDHAEDGPVPYDDDVRFLAMIANLVGQTLRLHQIMARDRERLLAEQARLEKERRSDAAELPKATIEGIIGNSPALRAVVEKVRIVAKTRSTVMLRGESGTGKEMFASAIHNLSTRKNGPFVKLNCAALPESVLESELFGHEKGAFTGAVNQRKGRFELAHGGTLFLDEIGEISASFQAKLLRVLQEGEFERVGGTKSLKVDVRLVCATNRDLEAEVSKGTFRADLYYRLAVVPVFLPSLRERKEDVPLLASEFVKRFNHEHGSELTLNAAALGILNDCYFPGNVRELENCVRRTATLARGKAITDSDFACQNDGCLSAMLWKGAAIAAHPQGYVPLPVVSNSGTGIVRRVPAPVGETPATSAGALHDCPVPGSCPVNGSDTRSERERLIDAMETAGWVQAKAARILGLTPRQVGYALRKHDIELKKF